MSFNGVQCIGNIDVSVGRVFKQCFPFENNGDLKNAPALLSTRAMAIHVGKLQTNLSSVLVWRRLEPLDTAYCI